MTKARASGSKVYLYFMKKGRQARHRIPQNSCFVLVCPFYRDLRIGILPRYYNNWPTQQKFLNLMKSSQTSVLKKLAKYVYIVTARLPLTFFY